jgi:outer membrane protein assembly factor BamB
MDTSCVTEDLLVGVTPDALQVVDLATLQHLWQVKGLVLNPPVSDGRVVIVAEDDVTAFDLRTGAQRWQRRGSDFGGKCWQMGFIWRDLFFVKVGEPLLLTAFEVNTGRTVWRTDFPVQWCEPYGERAYGIEANGAYKVLDLGTGKLVFERKVAHVPMVTGPKEGLTVERDPGLWPWRGTTLAVSETHVFLLRQAGQVVALGRDTGEVEQVVEIDGMPAGLPIIYENRLLLTDFNACVYCFEGAA